MVPEIDPENGPENEPEIGLEVKKHFFSLESFFLFSLVKNTFRSSKICIENIFDGGCTDCTVLPIPSEHEPSTLMENI